MDARLFARHCGRHPLARKPSSTPWPFPSLAAGGEASSGRGGRDGLTSVKDAHSRSVKEGHLEDICTLLRPRGGGGNPLQRITKAAPKSILGGVLGHPCLQANHGVFWPSGPSLGQQEIVRIGDVVGTLVGGPWAVDGALAERRGGSGEEGSRAHGGLRRHRGQRVGGGHGVGFHLAKGQDPPLLVVPGMPSAPVRRKGT